MLSCRLEQSFATVLNSIILLNDNPNLEIWQDRNFYFRQVLTYAEIMDGYYPFKAVSFVNVKTFTIQDAL